MREFLFLSAASVLVSLVAGCSHAPPAQTVRDLGESTFFGSSKVTRYRLANGLKILVLPDRSAPTFSYQTWFHVGSRDEENGLTGLAHLFEHMMFKQTKTLKDGEFDRILEAAGVEGENAFTMKDLTAYVQSLPKDKLELIARLESDRMANLVVSDDNLNKEREVVQNERRWREENNPDGLMEEKLFSAAFARHSYHWPIIGYEADLRNAKQPQVAAFFKRYYAPNNATIVVVGDVEPVRVATVVARYYGALPASRINRPQVTREPRQTAPRSAEAAINAPVEKLQVGYHVTDAASVEFPALEVLRNVLASGRGSRLYRKLVDAGIATDVEIDNEESIDPGLFIIAVTLQKGRHAGQALAVIDREIQALARERVAAPEIERAVSMHRLSLFESLGSNSKKAHFLGFYETITGRFERGVEIADALKSIDAKELARVTRNYLRKDNRTVVMGVPRK